MRIQGMPELAEREMIKEYYEKICSGEDIRGNLISLREELKSESSLRALAYCLAGDFGVFCALLKHEDAKVRKNAALILGKMESEDLLPVLFEAYQKETTRFIRPDYLKAISEMDYRSILKDLKSRLKELREMDPLPEERKHVSEEIRILQDMVIRCQKNKPHPFLGETVIPEMILITNRCQREITASQLENVETTYLAGGIRVKNVKLDQVLGVRTWSEMLFPLHIDGLLLSQPEKTGQKLMRPVLEMMRRYHEGDAPYFFRIELRGKISPEKKGGCIRKIADGLERQSDGLLINSVNQYEAEIRLLERKDGTLVPMMKLYTIADRRFAYREEVIASSVAPVNAALTASLARPYLKEHAQVLDPFCGVGTMLLERNYAVHADTMYGIDIFGEAIDKARKNTEHANCIVHYINKDFFEFEHEYLFDEIITDMPQATASRKQEEIEAIYRRFFAKAKEVLKKEAVMILYSTQPEYVLKQTRAYPQYRIAEQYLINEKNHTTVFIIQVKGE